MKLKSIAQGCALTGLFAMVALGQSPSQASNQIENPVYARWAKFKAGASAKIEAVTETPTHRIEQTTILKLVELDDKKAVVDMTVEIRRDGRTDSGPAQTYTHQRWFTPAPGISKESLAKSRGVLEEGKEKLTVAGKVFDTTWTKTKHRVEAGDTFVKAWYCDEAPGGLVKEENETPATKSKTKRELVEFSLPK